ncbi:MAG: hypothetical protein NC917_03710 [Candidatus Omnitrophica bacterium]|nr:hypothetical protein [Candidatus Omnitrophota bacterium]
MNSFFIHYKSFSRTIIHLTLKITGLSTSFLFQLGHSIQVYNEIWYRRKFECREVKVSIKWVALEI